MTFHVILQGGLEVEVLVTEAAAIVWGAGGGNALLNHQEPLLDPRLQVLGMHKIPTLGEIYYYYYVGIFRIICGINSLGFYF